MGRRGVLSIKCLNIAMSCALVIVTGAITISLSLDMGERAYSEKKDACEVGLSRTQLVGSSGMQAVLNTSEHGAASCFRSGEENVRYLNEQLLNRVGDEVAAKVQGYLKAPAVAVQTMVRWLSTRDPAVLSDPNWRTMALHPFQNSVFRSVAPEGVTDLLLHMRTEADIQPTINGFWQMFLETPKTVGNSPDEPHVYLLAKTIDYPCSPYGRRGGVHGGNDWMTKSVCESYLAADGKSQQCMWCGKDSPAPAGSTRETHPCVGGKQARKARPARADRPAPGRRAAAEEDCDGACAMCCGSGACAPCKPCGAGPYAGPCEPCAPCASCADCWTATAAPAPAPVAQCDGACTACCDACAPCEPCGAGPYEGACAACAPCAHCSSGSCWAASAPPPADDGVEDCVEGHADGYCEATSGMEPDQSKWCYAGHSPPDWYNPASREKNGGDRTSIAVLGVPDKDGVLIDEVPNMAQADKCTTQAKAIDELSFHGDLGSSQYAGSPLTAKTVCPLPDVPVTLGWQTRALTDQGEREKIHWAPVSNNGPLLSTKCFASFWNENAPVNTATADGKAVDKILGFVSAGIDILQMSKYFTEVDLPAGSRLYGVQVNPFYQPISKCKDGMLGLDKYAGWSCEVLVGATEGGCAAMLSTLTQAADPTFTLADECPVTCNACPKAPPMGTLIGASHGESRGQRPLLESSYGTNYGTQDTEWETTRGAKVHGLPDVDPIHATDSSDPVIQENARWVVSHELEWEHFDPAVMYEWVAGDGSVYWMKVRTARDRDMLCYITLLVRKDEVLRTINAATQATKREIETSMEATTATVTQQNAAVRADIDAKDKQTEDDKDKSFMIMLIVILVVIAILLTASVAFGVAIVKPIKKLEREMASVARMDLDEVDGTLSTLAEVHGMQKSFLRMVRSMKEYRNYMPQSILLDETVSVEEEEEAPVAGGGSTVHSAQSKSKSKSVARSSRHSQQHGVASSAGASSRSAALNKFLANKMAEGLKKKKITFVVVNSVGWHARWDKRPEREQSDHHHSMMETLFSCVTAGKGCPDTFSGDRVLFSFNAVRPMGTHRTAACKAALDVNASFSKGSTAASTTASTAVPEYASISVVGADAKVGNMGCDGMKKFAFMSLGLTFAYAVERYGRRVADPGTILCDHLVRGDASSLFSLRHVDVVLFPKYVKKDLNLFEVLSQKTAGEDEWMYQMEEGEKGDVYREWDKAVAACFKGDLDEAKAQTDAARGKAPNNREGKLADRLQEWASGQLPAQPTEIIFH